jgi:hypothetical protein
MCGGHQRCEFATVAWPVMNEQQQHQQAAASAVARTTTPHEGKMDSAPADFNETTSQSH